MTLAAARRLKRQGLLTEKTVRKFAVLSPGLLTEREGRQADSILMFLAEKNYEAARLTVLRWIRKGKLTRKPEDHP